MKLYFLIPGDINSLTGGYLYNKHIVQGLKQRGHDVTILSVAEPLAYKSEIEAVCRIHFENIKPGDCVIVDSLLLAILNKIIKDFRNRLLVIGLIHLPTSFDPVANNRVLLLGADESEAMSEVSLLIVTGRYMMDMLIKAGASKEKLNLVEPGVDRFIRKQRYSEVPFELLCISNYSGIKAQLVLAGALRRLREKNWIMRLYGNMAAGNEYLVSLRSYINREKLQDRILLNDRLGRKDITSVFLNADLFVLPSIFESYGMVLTESLAHGIPVITTTAGNIPVTVPGNMGLFVEPGREDKLASALDELFSDREKYRTLCEAAAGYYKQARSWETAVVEFEKIITSDTYK